jgi:hypothetical protein
MNENYYHSIYYLIPKEALDDLIQAIKDIRRIQAMFEDNNSSEVLGNYISEDDAMKLLDRKKTWFFNKRKSGELPGRKAAGRWYYDKTDIRNYIKNEQ